ncbi:MAG: cbb3-type cytochrome oxidase assembly protein CcoS [Betaproteobacteria bacterium]|nr:cbb3-type cytochrome oxidase assembly protein CcoS [Betaproteobacteria bacterium]
MDASLMVLIPVSVFVVALILGVLWWAARSGQFDDLEGPAHAILMDDDNPPAPPPAQAGAVAPAADSQSPRG